MNNILKLEQQQQQYPKTTKKENLKANAQNSGWPSILEKNSILQYQAFCFSSV